MIRNYDVAVIGAGIVGMAHAWMAARRGHRVVLFDRSARAQGASIRNFGMIWPIGQPAGELYEIALRSREFWLELNENGVTKADPCGAVHLAHRQDEFAVLEEFCSHGAHDCKLLSPAETRRKAPVANPSGLLGSLWSPTELRVDPRVAVCQIASWLRTKHNVTQHFATPVIRVNDGLITSASGIACQANQIIICSGSDLKTLFPEVLAASGLRVCKLQMLRTKAQDATIQQHAHIASGLTLRHYTSFEACPSLPALRKRVAAENPELDRFGIHVMATRTDNGEFILGDSHEYDEEIVPFDKGQIDELILRELRKIMQLPDWSIEQRWHGVYAKHPSLPVFECDPQPGIHVCVGTGGAGMTMSFGLADRWWRSDQ